MNVKLDWITISIIVVLVVGSIGFFLVVPSKTHYEPHEEMLVLKYDRAKCNLAEAVQSYIDSVAPMSALGGLELVDLCEKYEIDVCFALAQGQKESHFGTQGLARKTNSVWNVFAYDGLKHKEIPTKGRYETANASIEPYLKLLHARYLCGNKTEYDLLDKFVNVDGKRYASAIDYEKDLRNIYEKIKTTTDIDILSQEVRKYKMLRK